MPPSAPSPAGPAAGPGPHKPTPPAWSPARLRLSGRRDAEREHEALLAPLVDVLAWHVARAVDRRALAGDPRAVKFSFEDAGPAAPAMSAEAEADYADRLADPEGWIERKLAKSGVRHPWTKEPIWTPPEGSRWVDGILIVPPPPEDYLREIAAGTAQDAG